MWDSAANVATRVTEIKAAEAAASGAIGTPSPIGQNGILKSFDINVKRQDLPPILIWEGLLSAPVALLPPSPLVGKIFEMPMPITLNSGPNAGTTGCALACAPSIW